MAKPNSSTNAPGERATSNIAWMNALKTQKAMGAIEIDCEHPDAVIIRAWNKRQEALAEVESRCRYYDVDDSGLELFNTLDDGIPDLPATTPLGLLPKLWIAMAAAGSGIGSDEGRAQSDAIRRGDYDEVSTFVRELDWDQQVIFKIITDIMDAQRSERFVSTKKEAA